MISRLLFSHRCYHGGQMHQFEKRHMTLPGSVPLPTGPDLNMILANTYNEDTAKVLGALRGEQKLYRGDVCVWCGKVVNEQGTPA